jgi:hypothetical protein
MSQIKISKVSPDLDDTNGLLGETWG